MPKLTPKTAALNARNGVAKPKKLAMSQPVQYGKAMASAFKNTKTFGIPGAK